MDGISGEDSVTVCAGVRSTRRPRACAGISRFRDIVSEIQIRVVYYGIWPSKVSNGLCTHTNRSTADRFLLPFRAARSSFSSDLVM
jgi:hypothetical protein